MHTSTTGFLSSFDTVTTNAAPIKLYITADTDTASDFDTSTLKRWRDEGFNVTYLPFASSDTDAGFKAKLKSIVQSSGVGERMGIVAYGAAASVVLDFAKRPGSPRLCAVVAYYPETVPDTRLPFPVGVQVLVHLAGDEVGVRRRREVLGIQAKEQVTTKNMPRDCGVGGRVRGIKWPAYVYEGVEAGFAEGDLEEFDAGAAGVASSRSLEVVKRAFGIMGDDMEEIWERNCDAKYRTGDVEALMATITDKPSVNYVPVMVGGSNAQELRRFYEDYFLPDTPPSWKMKLISRTVGADQVIDELFVEFDHTQEVSWILPGIPPSNKHVEIPIVVIVKIRAGKIEHERTYWDQASVLVQIGLLDSDMVSPAMKKMKVERLPIVGSATARKVKDLQSEPSNQLLDDW